MFEYTDPEGNVISESEVQRLAKEAKTKLSYYTTEKKLKRRAVKAKEETSPFPKTEGLDPLGVEKMQSLSTTETTKPNSSKKKDLSFIDNSLRVVKEAMGFDNSSNYISIKKPEKPKGYNINAEPTNYNLQKQQYDAKKDGLKYVNNIIKAKGDPLSSVYNIMPIPGSTSEETEVRTMDWIGQLMGYGVDETNPKVSELNQNGANPFSILNTSTSYSDKASQILNGVGRYTFLDTKEKKLEYLSNDLLGPSYAYEVNDEETGGTKFVGKKGYVDDLKKILSIKMSDYTNADDLNLAIINASKTYLTKDPAYLMQQKIAIEKVKPLIEAKKNELINKYGLSDQKSVDKVNKELSNFFGDAAYKELQSSKAYQNLTKQFGAVINTATEELDLKFERGNDFFLSAMDVFKAVSPTAGGITESISKGWLGLLASAKQTRVSLKHGDVAELTSFYNKYKNIPDNTPFKLLDDWKDQMGGIEYAGMVGARTGIDLPKTYGEARNRIKSGIEKLNKETTAAIKGISETKKYINLFDKADLKDGIDFKDIVSLTSEQLPNLAITTAGVVTANPLLVGLGVASMFTQEYGNQYYDTVVTGLEEELGKPPSDEQVSEAIVNGRFANRAEIAAFAALSSGLEYVSELNILRTTGKALGLGSSAKDVVGSLLRGEVKAFGEGLAKKAYAGLGSSLGEYLTEGIQQGIAQVGKGVQLDKSDPFKYVNINEIKESGEMGFLSSIALPFGGAAASQSLTEIRSVARKVAYTFNLDSSMPNFKQAEEFFKLAEAAVNVKAKDGLISKDEQKAELDNLRNFRNTGLKIPKKFSKEGRKDVFDLLIEKNEIQSQIKGKDPILVANQKNEIDFIDAELALIARKEGVKKDLLESLSTKTSDNEKMDAFIELKKVNESDYNDLLVAAELSINIENEREGASQVAITDKEIFSRAANMHSKEQFLKENLPEGELKKYISAAEKKSLADFGENKFSRNDYISRLYTNVKAFKKKTALANYINPESFKSERTKLLASAANSVGLNEDNLTIKEFNSREEYSEWLFANLKGDEESKLKIINSANSTARGFTLPANDLSDGKPLLVVNAHVSEKSGTFTTGQHELFHFIVDAAFEKNPELAITIGESLKTFVEGAITNENFSDTEFSGLMSRYNARLENGEMTAVEYWKEVFPQLSEAFRNKDIVIKDSLLAKLVDVVRQFLQAMGISNIEIKDGKDAYNFIKDYNAGFEKGDLGQAFKALVNESGAIAGNNLSVASLKEEIDNLIAEYDEGYGEMSEQKFNAEKGNLDLKLEKAVKQEKATVQMSSKESLKEESLNESEDMLDENTSQEVDKVNKVIKEHRGSVASAKAQEIYNEKGTDGAFDIIKLFRPMTLRIAETRRNAPGYNKNKDLLIDEIETGVGGILDLIRDYNPENARYTYSSNNGEIQELAITFNKKGEATVNGIKEPALNNSSRETIEKFITESYGKIKTRKQMPITAFVSNIIGRRAITASRRILDKEFSKEVMDDSGSPAYDMEDDYSSDTTLDEIRFEEDRKSRLINPIDIMGADMSKEYSAEVSDYVSKLTPEQLSALTFANMKDIAPAVTAKFFGTTLRKVTDSKANLATPEIPIIQKIIYDNRIKLINLLPSGAILEGTPARESLINTGLNIPRKLQQLFYNQKERLGKGAGLIPFELKKNITQKDFLEAFGINEDGSFKSFGGQDPRAQTILAMIRLYGRITSNTAVRLEASQALESYNDLKAGTSNAQLSLESDFNTILERLGLNPIERIWDVLYTEDKDGNKLSVQRYDFNKLKLILESKNELYSILPEVITNNKVLMDDLMGRNWRTDAFQSNFYGDFKQVVDENKNRILDKELVNEITFMTRAGYRNIALNNPRKFSFSKETNEKILELENFTKKYGKYTNLNSTRLKKVNLLVANSNKLNEKNIEKELTSLSKYSKTNKLIAEVFIGTLNDWANEIGISGKNRQKRLNTVGHILLANSNTSSGFRSLSEITGVVVDKKASNGKSRLEHENAIINVTLDVYKKIATGQRNIEFSSTAKLIPSLLSAKRDEKLYMKTSDSIIFNNFLNDEISSSKGRLKKINTPSSKVVSNLSLDSEFNKIIQDVSGMEDYKKFSEIVGKRRGASKNKFDFYVPPSAADFELLLYNFMGKGKEGDAHKEFFNNALLKPYANGVALMDTARQSIKREYKSLLKAFPEISSKLEKLTPDKDFTIDQALRVSIWNGAGVEIPGLSERDTKKLTELVDNDPELSAFKQGLMATSRQENGWTNPSSHWDADTIISDLYNITEGEGRKQFLGEFIDNASEVFGTWEGGKLVGPNMNKIEAVYGTSVRESLEDSLYRMTNGKNKSFGADSETNKWNSWVNGSVGTIMFLNTRSAALQLTSAVNFLNFRDNNPFAAASAFANQKQYWSDFAHIFNSDKLKERRGGLKDDIQAAEIANAARGNQNKVKAVVAYMFKLGYTPTQIADSFAIASGGAPFYRNRIKSYLKEGKTEAEAEALAWQDFSKISDETQQSGDPKDISKQQASAAGRFILAFQNTTMQQSRLVKKSYLDLKNGRGDAKTHISKIVYYLAVQNIIFSSLQSALFSVGFGSDDDDDIQAAKREKDKTKKIISTVNGVVDSILRGTGFGGAIVATLKNVTMKYLDEKDKKFKADYAKVVLEAANISPPIGSKLRKMYSGFQQTKYDKDLMAERGWGVTQDGRVHLGPMYDIVGSEVEGFTNLPMARLANKVENISEAMNSENKAWQRVMVGLGWNPYTVGIEATKGDVKIKAEAKEVRKVEGIAKGKATREAKKKAYDDLPTSEKIKIAKAKKEEKRQKEKLKKKVYNTSN